MPTLTVEPEGVVVTLREGETILEGLYRNGYAFRDRLPSRRVRDLQGRPPRG